MTSENAPRGPLADLRVVDLSTVVAGPGCTRYLADFGATVVNVERPGGGDTTRHMGFTDPNDADGTSLFWKLIGRNKCCVVVDLKDPTSASACCGSSTAPTCWSRTCGPAASNVWAWGPTCSSIGTPDW